MAEQHGGRLEHIARAGVRGRNAGGGSGGRGRLGRGGGLRPSAGQLQQSRGAADALVKTPGAQVVSCRAGTVASGGETASDDSLVVSAQIRSPLRKSIGGTIEQFNCFGVSINFDGQICL